MRLTILFSRHAQNDLMAHAAERSVGVTLRATPTPGLPFEKPLAVDAVCSLSDW
jgi:hypothetical protein